MLRFSQGFARFVSFALLALSILSGCNGEQPPPTADKGRFLIQDSVSSPPEMLQLRASEG